MTKEKEGVAECKKLSSTRPGEIRGCCRSGREHSTLQEMAAATPYIIPILAEVLARAKHSRSRLTNLNCRPLVIGTPFSS